MYRFVLITLYIEMHCGCNGDIIAAKKQKKDGKISTSNGMNKNRTVNRKYRDAFFAMFFALIENQVRLVNSLLPGNDFTEKEIRDVTIRGHLGKGVENDLGLFIRNKYLLLVEAQRDWPYDAFLRMFRYAYDEVQKVLKDKDSYSDKKDFPQICLYVLYTGNRKDFPRTQKLSDLIGETDIDITVHFICGSDFEDGPVYEYASFVDMFTKNLIGSSCYKLELRILTRAYH